MYFEEYSDAVASAVFVVVTEVPERRSCDDVDLIEFQAVRESERCEIDGSHQHPCVRFDLLDRWLSEMNRSRYVRSAVCKKQCTNTARLLKHVDYT